MSQRYAPVVTSVNAHNGRAGCEAVIERDARGLQLTLRLPRDANEIPVAAPTIDPPTVVIPAVLPATATGSTFTKHRKAWIVAGAVVAVLFFAAIANGDEEPVASLPPAEETTTTVVDLPTSTTTTTTTPPPTTTTTVAQPPPPEPTTEQPAAPPPVADPAPQQECDPNYTGCVPIASDVDCAGGSGNGPAYVEGPIRVIGTDKYDLDRDGNGIACE